MNSVLAVEVSANRKLGPISATYVSQASCPDDCPLRGAGCYAEGGLVGFITRRLNSSLEEDPVRLARQEAHAIATLTGERDLRVHVVGDCRTNTAARIVASAMRRHRRKHGRRAWTYTHSWRRVRRATWQGESGLASCDYSIEVLHARERGYASALVVPRFLSDRAHDLAPGVRVIPCPAQTRDAVTCQSCGLCMNADRLFEAGLTIAFAAHGSQQAALRERLSLPVL